MIIPVILSGGSGSRLWPLSRELHPKPFIRLNTGKSLLQNTYERAATVSNADEIITVTNRDLFFRSKDEFEASDCSAKNGTFLLEPVRRNSAGAIAVAAHYALKEYGPECVLFIMPADHLIEDVAALKHAVDQAIELALQDKLVTFGIEPTSPETGYGYIQADGNLVRKFVEKPDLETAQDYLSSGDYFWNSGMFCTSVGRFMKELSLYAPEIAEQSSICLSNATRYSGEGWQQFEIKKDDFIQLPNISVDYAILEKSENIGMVSCNIGWSDIGSWPELGSLYPKDQHDNNISDHVISKDMHNCIVHSTDRLIATLGISDLFIADTADAVLVAHKDRAQDVRRIVDMIKSTHPSVFREFPTVHRPWGTYTVLQERPSFKIKRIEIKPGASLSLQSHKYRSEHWVVVHGKALVTNEGETIELETNQSTYIPAQNKHRLQNPTENTLIIIEVQLGEYLGEDDIVRYSDVYGRTLE